MTPITITNLSKYFGDVAAVDDISLQIPSGSLFFLLGPSGCGKTTLLRMIAGFTEPDGGQIRFGDRDVTKLAANKRNCAMVFQGYALWPHLTVAQNVGFGLDVRKVSSQDKKTQIVEALKLVRMEKYGDRKPNALSGGQQQRVALARALVVKPTVLLLDEPLSNLDARLRQQMRSEIRGLCKKLGITAVYVTHDQKEALSMADQIAVINNGCVVQVCSPDEIYRQPHSEFVADFLGDCNFIKGVIKSQDDQTVVMDTPIGLLHSASRLKNLKQGDEVTCSFRPSAMSLVEGDGDESVNTFSLKLIESEYLGETIEHRMVTVNERDPSHEPLTMKMTQLHPGKVLAEDRVVKVCVDPAEVVAFDGPAA